MALAARAVPLHHTLARHVPRAARFSFAPQGAAQGRTRTRPSAPIPFARGAGTTLTSAAAPRVATPSGVPWATRSQAASRPGRNWSNSTERLGLPCPSATSEPKLVQGRVSWPPRGRRPQPRTELRCQSSAERNLWPCGHAARPRPRNFSVFRKGTGLLAAAKRYTIETRGVLRTSAFVSEATRHKPPTDADRRKGVAEISLAT